MKTREVPIAVSLDLRSTLRPLHGRFRDDGWWLTARTPEGPATLHLSRTRDELLARAWGEGADWLLGRAGSIAGLDDNPEDFQPENAVVAELHRKNPGRRFGRTDLVFDSLVIAICGQKVTGQEAAKAVRGLRDRFSDSAPGPDRGLKLPPDPQKMAAAPYYEYHALHLEKRRADVLRTVAKDSDQLESLVSESAVNAAAVIERYHGVSVWTSASTLEVSHGDPDQVAVGDFHFKHIVVHHLTGRDRGTDDEMLDLLEPFRPHRGRTIRLLHLLGHEPKFGPRLAPRDITQM